MLLQGFICSLSVWRQPKNLRMIFLNLLQSLMIINQISHGYLIKMVMFITWIVRPIRRFNFLFFYGYTEILESEISEISQNIFPLFCENFTSECEAINKFLCKALKIFFPIRWIFVALAYFQKTRVCVWESLSGLGHKISQPTRASDSELSEQGSLIGPIGWRYAERKITWRPPA